MMGPGARKDTLDDIFGAHNYRVVKSFRMFTILEFGITNLIPH